MAWQLLVVHGADQDRHFPIPDEGTATIGSSHRNCDIVLHDDCVARIHCQVGALDNHVLVADLDSAGGTFVNGQRIAQQEMRAGDVLRVGNSRLRLAMIGDTIEEVFEAAEVVEQASEKREQPAPNKTPEKRLAELSGRTLGPYQIGAPLGKGHHGMTFRALDAKTRQVVALKVLAPIFPADDGEMQPFVKTLRVMMRMQHTHLVKHVRAGRSSGFCWLAQEHIEGESLAQLLGRMGSPGKLTWQHAVRLGIHVGRALEYVHNQNQAHGNITPANVLVRLSDRRVKLNDHLLGEALQGSRLQARAMKPKLEAELGYLAPELTDPAAEADHRTDMYGLGAIMYARMTCRPPFEGKSREQTLLMIRQAEVMPPSEYQSAIPSKLEDLVLILLARRPERRTHNMAEVLHKLERIAAEEGVEF
jgi:serine/threonine protein kinase